MKLWTVIIGLSLAAACVTAAHANATESTAGKTVTVDEAQGPSHNRITPKRHPSTPTTRQEPSTMTPKHTRTATAATSAPHSSRPGSLGKAPISCLEACRAQCEGPKKGKSACGPVYQACIAAC